MFIELFNLSRFLGYIYRSENNVEELIELSRDGKFEITIHKSTPEKVLDKCSKCISYTWKESSKKHLPFATTCRRETGFSHYMSTKKSQRDSILHFT